MSTDAALTPFTIDVPDELLADLRRRLLTTRWPEAVLVDVWSQGPPLSYVQEVCNYWANGYPAVMVTDTAFIRNEHYHTAEDTPDSLDYNRMAYAVDGVVNAVLHLATE